MGHRGPVEFPPQSPDLTPPFFLWDFLKNKVYGIKPTTVDELKASIDRECAGIQNEMFFNVFASRCQLCIDRNGHQFVNMS